MRNLLFVLCLLLFISSSVVGQDNPVEPDTSKEVIFVNPDTPPHYPGGDKAVIEYMKSVNIAGCIDSSHTPSSLFLSFVVDTVGNVTLVEIAKSSGVRCFDLAYLNHLRNMPRWTPGKWYDKIVSTKMVLPVRVRFDD